MTYTLSRLLLVTLGVVFWTSCATMQSQWEAAKSVDTIAAYEEFLGKHRQGELAQKALQRIEVLSFEEAKAKNDPTIYERFLSRHPQEKLSSSIRNKLNTLKEEIGKQREKQDWDKTKSQNSLLAYEGFLKKYPNGEFSKEAMTKIEDLLWGDILLSKKNYDSFDPIAPFTQSDAKQLRKRLANKIDLLCRQYIQKYPDGRYSKQANEMLVMLQEKITRLNDEEKYKDAMEQDTIEAYKNFIDKNPSNVFVGSARQRLNDIETFYKDKKFSKPLVNLCEASKGKGEFSNPPERKIIYVGSFEIDKNGNTRNIQTNIVSLRRRALDSYCSWCEENISKDRKRIHVSPYGIKKHELGSPGSIFVIQGLGAREIRNPEEVIPGCLIK